MVSNRGTIWSASRVRFARNHLERHITCGPTGADRDLLATEYRQAHRQAGIPTGSIVQPQ
jgi:hypothetical protein